MSDWCVHNSDVQNKWDDNTPTHDNDSPTYRINDRTNGKVFRSHEQVQSNALLSMADTDEGSKSSNDLEKVYFGTRNLESTSSDNAKDDTISVHQYDLMTLQSR